MKILYILFFFCLYWIKYTKSLNENYLGYSNLIHKFYNNNNIFYDINSIKRAGIFIPIYNKDEEIYNETINLKKENLLKKCHDCIHNNNDNLFCKNCPATEILNNLAILSPEKTLDEIINYNKSISRYGDGEYDIIFNHNIPYQKTNIKLIERLKEILKSDNENLIIGISNHLKYENLSPLRRASKRYYKKYVHQKGFKLIKLFDYKKTYGSSLISRFYISYKNHDNLHNYIKKLKKVWNNRQIVIIEGEKSRLGVGNDLFDNTISIERILCPSKNAFDLYDKILEEAYKINKNKQILIALGPTAPVLAYDLTKVGYQAIDIGHADIEYEWYLRNATSKIAIQNKYVNESRKGRVKITNPTDENYYKQIVTKILKSKNNKIKKLQTIKKNNKYKKIKNNKKIKKN